MVYNGGESKRFRPEGSMTEQNERVSPQCLADMCAELMRLSKESGFATGAYLLKWRALNRFSGSTRQPRTQKTQLDLAIIIQREGVVIKAAGRFD